jgi:pyruvate/2-oxoglutarate/acetoin dehydrogenase E1 component
MTSIPAEEHKDLLGREVKEDDYVAFTHHNMLYVGKVIKITPKQVRVVPIGHGRWREEGMLKYTTQCCLVGGPDLTFHILKNG